MLEPILHELCIIVKHRGWRAATGDKATSHHRVDLFSGVCPLPREPSLAANASPASSAPASKIRIRDLGKTFSLGKAQVDALKGIDLDVKAGEFICIVGPSGCGKTTLLRILAELEAPSDGEVIIARDN